MKTFTKFSDALDYTKSHHGHKVVRDNNGIISVEKEQKEQKEQKNKKIKIIKEN